MSDELSGLRVLVVEDEALLAIMMEAILKAAGIEVIGPVGTVREALQLVADDELDAALLDVNLHGQMVYPVADRLLEHDLPFVFVTAYAPGELPDRYHANELCQKPCPPDQLLRLLEHAVEHRAAR